MNFPLQINHLLLLVLVNWQGVLTQDDNVTVASVGEKPGAIAASAQAENATSESTEAMIAEIFGNGTVADDANKTVHNDRIPKMNGVGESGKSDIDVDSREVGEVSHGRGNVTHDEESNHNATVLDCTNSTVSCLPCGNGTINCDYKLVMEKTEYPNKYSVLGTVDAVAVAATVCLVSAVIGYFSCVGYRRYMQRKYGNSRVVVNEDVYDTTDLRYFEI